MECSVIILVSVAAFGTALIFIEAQTSAPVKQSIPSGCQTTEDCPDYFPSLWDKYQNVCCDAHPGPRYHCQEIFDDETLSYNHRVDACVYPVTCQAGTYAFVKTWTDQGYTYANIVCTPCTHDRFQPFPKASNEFRYANCTEVRQSCLRENGMVLAKEGNASHDNLCRCWWEGGYAPGSKESKCRSLEGFTQHDECQCEPKCLDGEKLNKDFECVTETTSTAKPTQTTTTNISKTSPIPTGDARNNGPVLFFILLIAFASAIWFFFAPML